MTSGPYVVDIVAVVTFTKRVYRQCKAAGDDHLELSREVRSLHTVLRHLKYEAEAPGSQLNRDRNLYPRDLKPALADCDDTLRELDELLRSLERPSQAQPGRPAGQSRLGSAEMDQLAIMRMKVINHKTGLTVFLDRVQLRDSKPLSATDLDDQSGQLHTILDKVDSIAAKMGQKAGSMMSIDDDDTEVWKQFRRELVAEGFSSAILAQNEDVLRAYIRQIDQNGLLDEMPPPVSKIAPAVRTQRWLDTIQPPTLEIPPPSFESLNQASESPTKERVRSEDNLKFPPSMKIQRLHPEISPGGLSPGREITAPLDIPIVLKDMNTVPAVEVPHLSTSYEKKRPDLDGGPPRATLQRSPSYTPLICTTENIIADDAEDQSRSQLDAPSSDRRDRRESFASDQGGTFAPSSPSTGRTEPVVGGELPKTAVYRPKNLVPESPQYETSPRSSGSRLVPPRSATYPTPDRYSSPRSPTASLAPDAQGNEIPLDAKWTRVRRSLISPEVLDQEGLRYEARPEFVAVLGVLSRDEISDLASRTTALRESRRSSRRTSLVPPTPPPRPILRKKRSVHFEDDPMDKEKDTSPDSDSSHSEERGPVRERRRDRERQRPRERVRPRDIHRDHRPSRVSSSSSYPPPASAPLHYVHAQYATPNGPPAPFSPGPPQQPYPGSTVFVPVPYYLPPSEESRKAAARSSAKENRSRWRENITAAGIGGAAASLFSVLTEAAADISI